MSPDFAAIRETDTSSSKQRAPIVDFWDQFVKDSNLKARSKRREHHHCTIHCTTHCTTPWSQMPCRVTQPGARRRKSWALMTEMQGDGVRDSTAGKTRYGNGWAYPGLAQSAASLHHHTSQPSPFSLRHVSCLVASYIPVSPAPRLIPPRLDLWTVCLQKH
jgi:hypothetical protein